ncbi:MAG: hypothetical protein PHD09_03935 [Candidatus Omnitrophica bacterium]|jgi:cell fate (sporulation/competence/biofilm development) regulator YlbF (YheA/YmcA/DUF963 family)|nr:hypothetical protein [Candidatus Omnitrophota bacterium]
MAEIYQVFCPVCMNAHGMQAERHATKRYIKIGQHSFWEAAMAHHVEEFGVIQESQGRGILNKVGYFPPESDPTGSYPYVKALLLRATKEWIDKGWLTADEVTAMLQGDIEEPAAGGIKPSAGKKVVHPKAKTARTKKAALPTPVVTRLPPVMKFNLKELKNNLSNLLNEEDKAKSIKDLEKALAGIDEDRVDISDVEEAISEYKEITRAGMSPEEYQEAKQTAFDFIAEQIEEMEENENYTGGG